MVPDTVKITFNFDVELTDKARSIVNNVDRGTREEKGAHICFKKY